MISFLGMDIVPSVHCYGKPKMQLAANVPVTPAFRAETNEWMISFFGREEGECFKVRDPFTGKETLYIAPDLFRNLLANPRFLRYLDVRPIQSYRKEY